MEVPPALKLQDHAYKYQNLFGLKEENPSQRYCQISWVIQICLK